MKAVATRRHGPPGQDTSRCAVCGHPLDHEPKLGEYLHHPECHDAVMRYVREAERRGEQRQLRKVVEWLRTLTEQVWWTSTEIREESVLVTAAWVADALERNENEKHFS